MNRNGMQRRARPAPSPPAWPPDDDGLGLDDLGGRLPELDAEALPDLGPLDLAELPELPPLEPLALDPLPALPPWRGPEPEDDAPSADDLLASLANLVASPLPAMPPALAPWERADPAARREHARAAAMVRAMTQARGSVARLLLRLSAPPPTPARPAKSERPRCGARTRAGKPCAAAAWWPSGEKHPRNGRCRLHGGLSTGPRTAEGRARIAEANRARARKRRRKVQSRS